MPKARPKKKPPTVSAKTARPRAPDPTAEKRRQRKAAYDQHRSRVAHADREESSQGREIGPLPPVMDPERRASCQEDLKLALETYFPDAFPLAWSSQHIEVIDALEITLRHGGLYALGMPRGSGKTTLCTRAAVLAMCFGWRKYLVLIGATQDHANELLDTVRVELESNELLLADFPEVCYPIVALEGIAQRAKGQTIDGEPTGIRWGGSKRIVLPHVKGSQASGSVIQAAGLLTRIRGMNFTTRDGKPIRPDAFLGDDLQTDTSAKNVKQVDRRETVTNGAVMGLAGPGKRIAGLATMTIMFKGDLADRMLDRKLNPQWHGQKFALVEAFPVATDLWEKYGELRVEDLRAGNDTLPKATQFYADNRKAMDRGAIVPWDARREPHELSAIQNAMNIRFARPDAFSAEYQNDPNASLSAEGQVVSADSDTIANRTGGYLRNVVPVAATRIVAGIDVQQNVLFYAVVALNEQFTGWVIDYGAWPKQPQLGSYWTLDDVQHTLARATGVNSLDGSLFAGINQLADWLLPQQYQRDDGALMRIDSALIDANWGPSTKTVYSVCRQSRHTQLLCFHGRGITAKQQSLANRKRKPGERSGEEWFMPATRGTNMPRHVIADTNAVKSILAQRWLQPRGEDGAWQLFNASTVAHRMFADHMTAEYPIETEGRGRKLYEWELRPGRDNHWLDCIVMAATAGLMLGCAPPGTTAANVARKPPAERKSLAQMRAEAQARRQSRR